MEKKYAVPSEGKFKNARLSLLLVIICSVLNLGFVFLGRYFVFSSTFTYELATLGMVLYEETSQVSYLVTFYIIAIVTIVPYLLCWIFSKKHVGWTIASLALFSLDTLYLLISYGPLLSEDLTILIDIALHALVIFELAVGVKAQFDMKKEIAQAQAQQLELEQIAQEQQQVQAYSKTEGLTVRTLTVTRAKSFAGCAVPIVVSVNGNEVLRVKKRRN